MPESPAAPPRITPEQLRTLLAVADLPIADERLPLLADEFNAQLVHAALLGRVLDHPPVPTFGPFDPTFPKIDLGEADR